MFKLLIIYIFCPCSILFAFVETETDFEYFKKGEEERKSILNHFLFGFGNSAFFEFARKDDLLKKDNSYTWNARMSSNDKVKIIAGNYHAKFSSGMILSRLNSSSDNPFLSSALRTQKTPFIPESNTNKDDSLFGSAFSYTLFDLDDLFLSAHVFYSDKKSYITIDDYEENETERSYLSINSNEGSKKEEVISAKISGASICFGYDLLKLNVNGLYSLAECGSERISYEGNKSYSAVSSYISFGVNQSEIFTEICFCNSNQNDYSKTTSYQYGMKHADKKYMISFIGKNISEKLYVPFGSPCGGKTPSVQNSFLGYIYMIDEIKIGNEIVQTRYKQLNQSETHIIDEKIFTEISLGKRIFLNGDFCRRKYYWKTNEYSDSLSGEVMIYFIDIIVSSTFAKNDQMKKSKSVLEIRPLKNMSADLSYVRIFGEDSYYPARDNISISAKYVSKSISSVVSFKRGFGNGEKYYKFNFSFSGLL